MALDKVAYQPYADPDEFIREVTDRIWVGRDIDHIRDNYEPDSIVHGSLGTAVGVDQVVEGSMMRIAQYPDHVGLAEDVIWEQRGSDAFLSSHLVFSADPVPTPHGIVTVRRRTIANCLYRRGRMVEEWVVRDNLAGALQLGQDPAELAEQMTWSGYSGGYTEKPQPDILTAGDSGARPDDHRAECELVLEMIETVWNQRNLSRVHDFFDRDLFLDTVGDKTVTRPDGYQRELLRLLQAFPSCHFEVRDIQTNHAERYAGLRIAVMWKLVGTYNGIAEYGPLTGAPVELMGVSQFRFHAGRIVREVRIYDEIGLRTQINATRTDTAYAFDNLY